MTLESAADLLQQLAALRLLDEEKLAAAGSLASASARSLAGELIRRDWLTPFQVNQLFQGKGTGLLLGSYILLEKLGEGGMGAVFKARNWKLGRIVALKLIRKDRLASPDIVRRFHREIQSVAQLDHPNIVRAHDADSVGDTHFLVMEYVAGIDLARLGKERGPLPVTQACHCIREAALGLQHAFEKGMVHRDIKPGNLLLEIPNEKRSSEIRNPKSEIRNEDTAPERGAGSQGSVLQRQRVKVLDFGLARLARGMEDDGSLTGTGVIMGTPDYIAPEQAREAHDVDIRADLYSLGCTFYFLLTGQPPFPKGSLGAKLLKHQMDEPEAIEQLRADMPENVVRIVRKLMAKKPEDRFQTPAELIHALAGEREPLSHSPTLAADPAGKPAEPTLNPFSGLETAENIPPPPRHGHLPWLIAGTCFALLAGLLLWRPWRHEEPDRKPHHPSVKVDAKQPWQDTGVDVKPGETVSIRYQGQWRREGLSWCGAEGVPNVRRGRTILFEAPALCLLARIGIDPAALDARRAFEAPHAGRLYLQTNEVDLTDCEGHLQVEVDCGEAGGEIPAPPLLPIQLSEEEFRPLALRFRENSQGSPGLRDALLAFAWKHGGLPQAGRAFDLVRRLPGPLDDLRASGVPAWERNRAGQPKELVSILGDTRGRHGSSIEGLAFQADRSLLAADSQGMVRVWDPETLEERRSVQGPLASALTVFLNQGREAISCSGSTFCPVRWDVKSGKVLTTFEVSSPYGSVTCSPDGKRTALLFQPRISIHDTLTGKKLRDLREEMIQTHKAVFLADSQRLVSAHSKGLTLWDAETGKLLRKLAEKGTGFQGLAVTSEGTLAAAGGVGKVVFWDLNDGPQRPSWQGHRGTVVVLAFSPNGELLASGDSNGMLRLWDMRAGKELASVQGHRRAVESLVFSGDGKQLVSGGGHDPVVRVWNVAGRTLVPPPPDPIHAGWVSCVVFTPDGKGLLSAGQDLKLHLWDLQGEKPRLTDTLTGQATTFASLIAVPEGPTLVGGGQRFSVEIFRMAGDKVRSLGSYQEHKGAVVSVDATPDGRWLLSLDDQGTLKLGPMTPAAPRRTVQGTRPIRLAAFSPNSRHLAWVEGPDQIVFGSLADLQQRRLLPPLGRRIVDFAFMPLGRALVMAYEDGGIQVREVQGEMAVRRLAQVQKGAVRLRVAPDGHTLAVLHNLNTIDWIDVQEGTRKARWTLPVTIQDMAFAPDSRHLALGCANGAVYLLRLGNPEDG